MSTVAVIPARYGSTRFPGKPLARIAGKPMLQWVVERTAAAVEIDDVWVATDDSRIMDAATDFGGKAIMTSPNHRTGTDRIAEALMDVEADIVVNVQGDEPLVPPSIIDRLVRAMQSGDSEMGTVAVPFEATDADPRNPNCVKVIVDINGYALYFSRGLIPYPREGGKAVTPLLHWGLYAYRREFLDAFVKWPPGRLEQCEMLEQLRALENGARIKVITVDTPTQGVDEPGDIQKVEYMLEKEKHGRG